MVGRRLAVRRRIYTKVAATVAVAATVIVTISVFLGLTTRASFVPLGIGIGSLTLGCLAWEIVERHAEKGVTMWAWCAVPLSIFFAFGSLPFLASAVYPPLTDFLKSKGRLEAHYFEDDRGAAVEVYFPHPMEQVGANLTLESEPLPDGFTEQRLKDGSPAWEWRSFQTLRVRLAPLAETLDLDGAPPTIRVNTLPAVERFRTLKGDAIPPQTIVNVRGR